MPPEVGDGPVVGLVRVVRVMPEMRAALRRQGRLAAVLGSVLVAAAFVAGCAIPARDVTVPGVGSVADAFIDSPFAVDGRLSARRGSEALAVHFRWTHAPPRDDLVVASPLGQVLAELSGDALARRVEARLADGRFAEATDWGELTERMLGVPLPVVGLAAWIRAQPRKGSAFTVEVADDGRIAVLRQDGWEVVYDYADRAERLPARVRLAYPGVELRLVIDRWE